MSVDHTRRQAAQDLRNEVRRIERHETEVRRLTNERWQRRIAPLMMTGSRPSDDFEGTVE